jgi:PAS domain S-box-containing protein
MVLTPFIVVLLVAAFAHYYTTSRTVRAELQSNELLNVGLARSSLNRDISQVVADLLFLTSYFEADALQSPRVYGGPNLQRLFYTFAAEKRLYDQIRFIDTSGRERIRVNYRNGKPKLVADEDLQDKRARYYFTETMGLSAGEIYISPLDLNVEQGFIEEPHKPMMRFAMPVFDDQGAKRGILVLNYLGERLLQEFTRAGANIGDHLHLLNQQGFWLSSPDRAAAWGFMLRHGERFATRHPGIWRLVSATVSGRIDSDDGLVTYETLTPWRVAAQTIGRSAEKTQMPAYAGQWKLVSILPARRLSPGLWGYLGRHLPLILVVLLSMLLGSWLLTRAQLQHRRAELQSEYERRFRRTLEDIQLAAVTIDTDNRLIFANDYFLQLGGWRREDILGRDWLSEFIVETQQQQVRANLAAIIDGGLLERRQEVELRLGNGRRRLIAWHNTPFLDAEARLIGITAVGEDVTERRQAEEKVRKLSHAVEQSPSIVLLTDRHGRIEYVNPKFSEVTGYRPEEVIGKLPSLLKSGDTPAGAYAELWQTIGRGGEWRGEFHNRRKNGELYWESAAISALRGVNGEIINYVAVKEDISEHKRLQAELDEQNRVLAHTQSLVAMGRMASMIAHDLRNPLSSVKMGMQILGKQVSVEQRELAIIGLEQIHYMEEILTDMLTFARPEALKTEWVNLDKLLDVIVGSLQRRIQETGARVIMDYQSGLPVVPADVNKLRQLFSNLISNALQSTEKREADRQVSIRVSWQLGQRGTEVRVELCDNGGGLADCDQARLFEPFYTTRSKGTGLGLAIVRQIVQQHGGEVSLQERRGGGVCAQVLLPATLPVGVDGDDANAVIGQTRCG